MTGIDRLRVYWSSLSSLSLLRSLNDFPDFQDFPDFPDLFLLNYPGEIIGYQKASAVAEKRRAGSFVGNDPYIGISRLRAGMGRLVWFYTAPHGGRPRKGIGREGADNGLDFRHLLFFRHLLVAYLFTYPLRGIPGAAHIFSAPVRLPDRRYLPRAIRSRPFRTAKTAWALCCLFRPFYLDRDRVPAFLGYGK